MKLFQQHDPLNPKLFNNKQNPYPKDNDSQFSLDSDHKKALLVNFSNDDSIWNEINKHNKIYCDHNS